MMMLLGCGAHILAEELRRLTEFAQKICAELLKLDAMMPDGSTASTLRSRIVDIDSQLLSILLPHAQLAQEDISKIAMLEHARTATWRLLVVLKLLR